MVLTLSVERMLRTGRASGKVTPAAPWRCSRLAWSRQPRPGCRVYRILCTGDGGVLRLLTNNSSRSGQITRVLRRIHQEYASDLDVAMLAREANMGTSTFHHAFREVTATSPVQYVKSIRLHRARTLLASQGLSAQDAARRVGYTSSSQFSREYRRMFGRSPHRIERSPSRRDADAPRPTKRPCP